MEAILNTGSMGSFEVIADGRLVFSKLKEGRFPTDDEVLDALEH